MKKNKVKKIFLIRDYIGGVFMVLGSLIALVFGYTEMSIKEKIIAILILLLGLILLVFAGRINNFLWKSSK